MANEVTINPNTGAIARNVSVHVGSEADFQANLNARRNRNGSELTDFQRDLLTNIREQRKAQIGAAAAGWQAIYDSCLNEGQMAIAERIKGAWMSQHGKGWYFFDESTPANLEEFTSHWNGVVNSITGGSSTITLPDRPDPGDA